MAKKKILIVMANVGNGHLVSSNAIKFEIEKKYSKEYSVKILDLFEEADVEPFNSSNQSYSLVSKNYFLESMSNLLFRALCTKWGYALFFSYTTGRMQKVCTEILNEENPDIVISTHPIVSLIVNAIKKSGAKFNSYVVISDLVTMFRPWADDTADIIFTPTQESADQLIRYGVSSKNIRHPFFPVRSWISKVNSKQEIVDSFKFETKLPLILLTGGGVGTQSLIKCIDKLVKTQKYNLVVVTGKLEHFKSELELKYSKCKNLRIFGYVENFSDFISAVDIVIGKPGPNTIVELELFKKKAIFTKVVGEQEKGNIEYIKRDPNFEYVGENVSDIESKIDELLSRNTSEFASERSFDETEKLVDEIILHSQS